MLYAIENGEYPLSNDVTYDDLKPSLEVFHLQLELSYTLFLVQFTILSRFRYHYAFSPRLRYLSRG